MECELADHDALPGRRDAQTQAQAGVRLPCEPEHGDARLQARPRAPTGWARGAIALPALRLSEGSGDIRTAERSSRCCCRVGNGRAESGAEADPLEVAVDQIIAVCDGDMRAALRAALIYNEFLERKLDVMRGMVSSGYSRPGGPDLSGSFSQ
jgi:hypothetical protein